MSKKDNPLNDNGPVDPPVDPPVNPAPLKTSDNKVPLKAFLSDRKLIKKHGRPVIKAFEASYRAEPARDDWNELLSDFVKKAR